MVALANFKCSYGLMQIKNIPIIVERSIAQSPLQQKQSSSYLYLESRIAEAVRTEENKPRFRDLQPRECQEATPNWAAVSQRVPSATGAIVRHHFPVTTQETDIRKGLKKKNMNGLGLAYKGQLWGDLQ